MKVLAKGKKNFNRREKIFKEIFPITKELEFWVLKGPSECTAQDENSPPTNASS